MTRQLERLEEQLEKELAEGRLSQREFTAEMREIQREFRAQAEEEAERAYDDRMSDFGY